MSLATRTSLPVLLAVAIVLAAFQAVLAPSAGYADSPYGLAPGTTLAPLSRTTPPVALGFGVPPDTSALAAIVLDEGSGAVLYEKNAHEALPPASLTKIATAVLALEQGNLDAIVQVDVDSRAMVDSSVMGLRPGDRFTLRDLVYGLMLPSGNDAALAIGRHLAGSDAAFVARMNELARHLGLYETNFQNPHGLSARNHVISAHDLAVLTRYAMSVPGFVEIVRTPAWVAFGTRTIMMRNVNSFLFDYPGADGVKTGWTERAGRTLVASATRNGRRVIVVLLNAEDRNQDATVLMNWAFANHAWPGGAGPIPVGPDSPARAGTSNPYGGPIAPASPGPNPALVPALAPAVATNPFGGSPSGSPPASPFG